MRQHTRPAASPVDACPERPGDAIAERARPGPSQGQAGERGNPTGAAAAQSV